MDKAREENIKTHRYTIPLLHATLWLAALLLSCYSGWMSDIDKNYQPICVFLIIYGTFMVEGGLVWWDLIADNSDKQIQLKDFAFIKNLFFNMALTLVSVVIFFICKIEWMIMPIGLTASWLKYIVCRLSPIVQETAKPYIADKYNIREV